MEIWAEDQPLIWENLALCLGLQVSVQGGGSTWHRQASWGSSPVLTPAPQVPWPGSSLGAGLADLNGPSSRTVFVLPCIYIITSDFLPHWRGSAGDNDTTVHATTVHSHHRQTSPEVRR